MRVLILHSRYASGPASGENRVVEDEAALLRAAGHRVWLRIPDPDVEGAGGRVRAGASATWAGEAARTVGALVRRERIDVVHAHNLFPTLSPAVLRAASSAGAAVLLSLHNYRLYCLPANLYRDGVICEACMNRAPWRGVRYRCYRASALASAALATSLIVHRSLSTFDRVTRFVAVSEFVKGKHVEAGFPADRIVVKPNFCPPSAARRGPGSYFLYLGRLAPEKGVGTLLEAWRGRPSLGRLLVVGDGPEAAALRSTAPDGVEFRGTVPPSEVPGLMGGARALLVPSAWFETSGRGIMEAAAAAVPSVAARIGAFPEAIEDGISGFLLPPGNAPAWAEAAGRFLDDEVSQRMGAAAGRLWSERFSPQRGIANLEAVYREAIEARSGTSRA